MFRHIAVCIFFILPTLGSAKLEKNVILISVDGLKRAYATDTHFMPNLTDLAKSGKGSQSASAAIPPRTIPNHTTMLNGLNPRTHGMLINDKEAANVTSNPSIFDILSSHFGESFEGAAVVAKKKLAYIVSSQGPQSAPLSIDGSFVREFIPIKRDNFVMRQIRNFTGVHPSEQTRDIALEKLADSIPNLLFIHFGNADLDGHWGVRFKATIVKSNGGWGGERQRNELRIIDRAIKAIVEQASVHDPGLEHTTFIITSDHGGHKNSHGGIENQDKSKLSIKVLEDVKQLTLDDFHPDDISIPWIIFGGESDSYRISDHIDQVDTAPTILDIFGLERPVAFEGQSAFVN